MLRHPGVKEQPGCALIFAAMGGRRKLHDGLREIGWEVQFAYVYQAVPVPPPASALKAIDAATRILSVWTSANALKQLAGSLEGAAWKAICRGDFLVTSQRLAAIARKSAQGQVFTTDGPGNEAIRDRVRQLI